MTGFRKRIWLWDMDAAMNSHGTEFVLMSSSGRAIGALSRSCERIDDAYVQIFGVRAVLC